MSLIDNITKKLDVIGAVLIFFVSLIFSILSVIRSHIYILTFVPLFFSLIYLSLRSKINDNFEINFSFTKKRILLNNILFFFSSTLYIFYLYITRYPYDFYYFILLLIIATSILCSIFSERDVYDLILLMKINLLFCMCIASVFYASPDIYGIDTLAHSRICQQILSFHNLPIDGEFYSTYYFYPIMQIFISEINFISSFPIRDSMFIISIFTYIITTFLLYTIAKKVSNSKKIGLLSVFIYCGAEFVIPKGFTVTPNIFGLIFFSVLFYIVFSEKKSVSFSLLFIISSISLILTHPYPPILFSIIIFVYLLSSIFSLNFFNKYMNKIDTLLVNSLILFSAMYILQLCIRSSNPNFDLFLNAMSKGFWYSDSPLDTAVQSLQIGTYKNISYDLSFSFFVFGFLAWLDSTRINKSKFNLLMVVSFLIVITYISSMFDIGVIPLSYRIWPFLYIPFSIVVAQGIFYFMSAIAKEREKQIYPFITVMILILIYFLSITSYLVSPDQGFYSKELGYRQFLTESEIAGLNYSLHKSNINTSIYSDGFYYSYTKYKGYDQNTLKLDSPFYDESFIILRKYFLQKPSIRLLSDFNKTQNSELSQTDFENILKVSSCNIVYDNANLSVYQVSHRFSGSE